MYTHARRPGSARTLVNGLARAMRPFTPVALPPTSVPSQPIQRILRVNGQNVLPEHHDHVHTEVKKLFKNENIPWTEAHANHLNGWLNDRNSIVDAKSLNHLGFNLHKAPTDAKAWDGMSHTSISADDLQAGGRRRKQERMGRALEPNTVQTPKRVPGLSKLTDQKLLRLAEPAEEEKEYWVRGKDDKLVNAKKRKMSSEDESRIVASGDEDNPSYVVWNRDRQRGHFYQAGEGNGNTRTYGSKKNREGYEYKISGATDGHSVQVQDDQRILGPFQKDAPHWKTDVRKEDGTTIQYPDTEYLPKNKKDEKRIERHPYNYHWENQEEGKHVRQKAIEAPALSEGSSFLHLNSFSEGVTANPNAGDHQDHIYPVPDRIHYRIFDTSGNSTHVSADNRLTADYSRPEDYDATTRRYDSVPGGVPDHGLNRTLGTKTNGERYGAREHLALATMPDTSNYPSATVLRPHDSGFNFTPAFRNTISGYQTPPSSPYHVSSGLEESQTTHTGDLSQWGGFEYNDQLVNKAEFDESKDETKFHNSRIKRAKTSNLTGDPVAFSNLVKPKDKTDQTDTTAK